MGAGNGKEAIEAGLIESIDALCDRLAERDERKRRDAERQLEEEERRHKWDEQQVIVKAEAAISSAMSGGLDQLKAAILAHADACEPTGGPKSPVLAKAREAVFQRRDEDKEKAKAQAAAQREADAERRWQEREDAEVRRKKEKEQANLLDSDLNARLASLRVAVEKVSEEAEGAPSAAASALAEAQTALADILSKDADGTYASKPLRLVSKLKQPPPILELVSGTILKLLGRPSEWVHAETQLADPAELVRALALWIAARKVRSAQEARAGGSSESEGPLDIADPAWPIQELSAQLRPLHDATATLDVARAVSPVLSDLLFVLHCIACHHEFGPLARVQSEKAESLRAKLEQAEQAMKPASLNRQLAQSHLDEADQVLGSSQVVSAAGDSPLKAVRDERLRQAAQIKRDARKKARANELLAKMMSPQKNAKVGAVSKLRGAVARASAQTLG